MNNICFFANEEEDKVKERTKDNPIFYVQYAYARINSLLRTLNLGLLEKINLEKDNLNINQIEEKIIKKVFTFIKTKITHNFYNF